MAGTVHTDEVDVNSGESVQVTLDGCYYVHVSDNAPKSGITVKIIKDDSWIEITLDWDEFTLRHQGMKQLSVKNGDKV